MCQILHECYLNKGKYSTAFNAILLLLFNFPSIFEIFCILKIETDLEEDSNETEIRFPEFLYESL